MFKREETIKLDDGRRAQLLLTVHNEYGREEVHFSALFCEKGKRTFTFPKSESFDSYLKSITDNSMSREEKAKAYKKAVIHEVGEDKVNSVLDKWLTELKISILS